VLDRVFKNPDALNEDVAVLMQPPLPPSTSRLARPGLRRPLRPERGVVVAAGRPADGDLTRSDLLEYLAHSALSGERPRPFSPHGDEDRSDDQRGPRPIGRA
jgi:hypothetical protein